MDKWRYHTKKDPILLKTVPSIIPLILGIYHDSWYLTKPLICNKNSLLSGKRKKILVKVMKIPFSHTICQNNYLRSQWDKINPNVSIHYTRCGTLIDIFFKFWPSKYYPIIMKILPVLLHVRSGTEPKIHKDWRKNQWATYNHVHIG